MSDEINEKVETEVRRVLGQEEEKYRDFLERQFRQIKWCIGVIIICGLGVMVFFLGRTRADVEATAKSQVADYLLQSRLQDEIKGKINLIINDAVEEQKEKADSDIKKSVADALKAEAGQRLNEATTKAINDIKESDVSSVLVPKGTIVAWHGNPDNIPEGWALCNGANGTPNLIDRYPIGTGSKDKVGEHTGSESHNHVHAEDYLQGEPLDWTTDQRWALVINRFIKNASNRPPSTYVVFIMRL